MQHSVAPNPLHASLRNVAAPLPSLKPKLELRVRILGIGNLDES